MARALSMPDTATVHTIDRIQGADGGELDVGVDCDGVKIGGVVLDRGGRDDLVRAFFEAERQAEAWAERYGGSDG